MKQKLLVTIGICAHNEQANIVNILTDILKQQHRKYMLVKIIVVSDGSSDDTIKRASSVKSDKIVIVNRKSQHGLTSSLNYLFSHFSTDILVKIDADVRLIGDSVIDDLITPFYSSERIGITSGKLIPIKSTSFFGKTLSLGREVWDSVRAKMGTGNNVYALSGGIFALTHQFAQKIHFPSDVWADVGYIYLSSLTKGIKFVSVKSAKVYFQPPKTVKDYVAQSSRYLGENQILEKYFSPKLIKETYTIPKNILLKYKMMAFLKHPFHAATLMFINAYIHRLKKHINLSYKHGWRSLNSTKIVELENSI